MTSDDPDPIPDGWTEGTVTANGVDLHYVHAPGDGPPVVVAHGVFDDALCREPLLRELAGDYDVVAYDARGHGRSTVPESGYDPVTLGTDLVGLVEALALTEPFLIGHSMGGDAVAAAAARRPDLPRGVVVIDPAGMLARDGEDGSDPEGVREQIGQWHDRTKAALLAEDDELRGHVEAGDEPLARRLADARLRVSPEVAAVFGGDWLDPTETYPDIAAPTLVLKADADAAGRERDRDLAAHLPDGRLVHVDGAGHCVFRDERETATRELRAFLEEH